MKRTLHPDLKKFFDANCLNPTPIPFLPPYEPVKMLILTALSCRGVTEVGGDNTGEIVSLFQDTIGTASQEPWCLSFLQSCVAYVESFGFASKLFPTEHCLTAWRNSEACRTIEPRPGDIIIYRVGDTSKGHAALITGIHPRHYDTVEGNTSNATGIIEREGDGVYLKNRPVGGFPKLSELGFLRIFG